MTSFLRSNRFGVLDFDNDNDSHDASSEKLTLTWRDVKRPLKINNKFPVIKKKIVKRENRNFKKILCNNMIESGSCPYGIKCVYAHSLDEQNIDANRRDAYSILTSTDKISVDLQRDLYLYRSLLGLTNMCEKCSKNMCTGGYNCKFGACAKKYHVCIKDLQTGDCMEKCGCVHLTDRGLKPFKSNNGTLLTTEFFSAMVGTNNSDEDSDYLSEISDDDSVKSTISDSECYKSIFDEDKKDD